MLTYLRISFESTSCRLVGCCEMRRWLDFFFSNTANYVEVFSGSDSKSEIRGRKKTTQIFIPLLLAWKQHNPKTDVITLYMWHTRHDYYGNIKKTTRLESSL